MFRTLTIILTGGAGETGVAEEPPVSGAPPATPIVSCKHGKEKCIKDPSKNRYFFNASCIYLLSIILLKPYAIWDLPGARKNDFRREKKTSRTLDFTRKPQNY